jgi:hypothetical protein
MQPAMQASVERSKRQVVALVLRTLGLLRHQGAIRTSRGRLRWEGDLEAQRLDADQETLDPGECVRLWMQSSGDLLRR